MANATQNIVLRGKLSYAKLLEHQLTTNFNKDGKEWKTDFAIDPASSKELKAAGIGDRVKTRDEYLEGGPFLSFKQSEFQMSGKPNKPVPVVDISGNPWPQTEDMELGNGTVADVRFAVVDYGPGKKKGVYIRGVRVLEHVPYEREAFAPLSEDDKYFQAAVEAEEAKNKEHQEFRKAFGIADELDDEIL